MKISKHFFDNAKLVMYIHGMISRERFFLTIRMQMQEMQEKSAMTLGVNCVILEKIVTLIYNLYLKFLFYSNFFHIPIL